MFLGSLLILVVFAVLQSVLLCLQIWEHRRFARKQVGRPVDAHPSGRALVVVPCKGTEFGLEENLRSVFLQDYADYEIAFVVERPDDPAQAVIAALMKRHSHPRAQIIFAGQAADCGQKVHNLLAATRHLPVHIEYLAFIDSDARAADGWLSALIHRLNERRKAAAVTGYRWFWPARTCLAHHLLYSINAGVAVGYGSQGVNPIWGGSWGIRRDRFDALRVRECWRNGLSDDLIVSRAIYRKGLRIAFEPKAMVLSPIDTDFRETLTFMRRQMMVVRCYLPWLWGLALTALTVSNIGLLVVLAVLLRHQVVLGAELWMFMGAGLILYGLGVFRGVLRTELFKVYFPAIEARPRSSQLFDMIAWPLGNMLFWMVVLLSSVGTEITWRDVTYRVSKDGKTRILNRKGPPGHAAGHLSDR